ncbi:hypothetical protein [uncultured Aquimarina sp.]|uniref:hypothetical protein n=1 Tax=uncultured Aquimarina sp. TaxID=575652 RepID=UPI0026104FD9|nr:hypothetical protein [uncultured Aquimarina sp.]
MKKRVPKILLVLLLVSVFTVGCSSDDGDVGSGSSFDFFIAADLDGVGFDAGVNEGSTTIPTYTLASGGIDIIGNSNCIYSYDAGFTAINDAVLPSSYFNFDSYYNGSCGSDAELSVFKELFVTGNESYIDNSSSSKGVEYLYVLNGTDYSTKYGDQTGSSFTITSIELKQELIAGDLYRFFHVAEGVFNCKVYSSSDPSDMLEITNGRFKIIIFAKNNGFLDAIGN